MYPFNCLDHRSNVIERYLYIGHWCALLVKTNDRTAAAMCPNSFTMEL